MEQTYCVFLFRRGRKEADVSVKRFEEGDAVEAHILSPELLPLSLTSSPAVKHLPTLTSSEMDKKAQEEVQQQSLLCLSF